MIIIELAFPVSGKGVPQDNAYGLYAAISRALDGHLPDGIAVASIGGPLICRSRIQVTRSTLLRIRTPVERIGDLLPLAGKFLDIGGCEIGLGIPTVHALRPAPELRSRFVTIKGYMEPVSFLQAAARQLEAMGVSGSATIPTFTDGPRTGEARRRVITIKDKTVVGFPLEVSSLSERDSYRLLASGVGGRRHLGAGIFVPIKSRGGQQ